MKHLMLIIVVFFASRILTMNGSQELDNNVIRVSTGDTPLFLQAELYDKQDKPLKMTGIGFDYLLWLTQRLSLTVEVTRYYRATKESNIVSLMGISLNGNWTGPLGDLMNNVSDLALTVANARPDYLPYFDITLPLLEQTYSMFGPHPEIVNETWGLLKPFTFWVWMFLLISLVFTPLVMLLLSKWKNPKKPNRKWAKITYEFLLIYFITVLTGQGQRPPLRMFRNAVTVAAGWCLAMIVISNAYKGLLTSYLTLEVAKPIVTSYSDLIANPEVEFFTFKNSLAELVLLSAEQGNMKLLGDIFRKNPGRSLPTLGACLEKVGTGPYVCFAPTVPGDAFIENDQKKRGFCTMARIGPSFITQNPVLVLRKTYPHFKGVHLGITEARSVGLDLKWLTKYEPTQQPCSIETVNAKAKAKTLTITNMFGPFMILFFGLGLSIIVFLLEWVAYLTSKRFGTRISTIQS